MSSISGLRWCTPAFSTVAQDLWSSNMANPKWWGRQWMSFSQGVSSFNLDATPAFIPMFTEAPSVPNPIVVVLSHHLAIRFPRQQQWSSIKNTVAIPCSFESNAILQFRFSLDKCSWEFILSHRRHVVVNTPLKERQFKLFFAFKNNFFSTLYVYFYYTSPQRL